MTQDIPALAVRNLSKRVMTPAGELVLLHDIGFRVARGESVAIVGASGSGKSTLLGLLAGLDVPSGGDVLLNGQSLAALDEEGKARLRGQCVGFVFQNFQLLPALTALENVMLPLELQGRADARAVAENFLARVGLSQRLLHYPRQLSGGEQQRVALARAFAGSPAVLFADEPTGNLDSATAAMVSDLLFQLNRDSGATLVLVTHDERLAARCQRRLRMRDGCLLDAAAEQVVG